MKTKQYYIFCGLLHLTTIDAKDAREATIYGCGILEGWRYCGEVGQEKRKIGITIYDEQRRKIFDRKYNS